MCGTVPQLEQGCLEVGNAAVYYLGHFLRIFIFETQIPGGIHSYGCMLSLIWHSFLVVLLLLHCVSCLCFSHVTL